MQVWILTKAPIRCFRCAGRRYEVQPPTRPENIPHITIYALWADVKILTLTYCDMQ